MFLSPERQQLTKTLRSAGIPKSVYHPLRSPEMAFGFYVEREGETSVRITTDSQNEAKALTALQGAGYAVTVDGCQFIVTIN